MKVLLIGATGVFGSRLARMLAEDGHDLILASRRGADALAAQLHATSLALDARAEANLTSALKTHAPQVVIDAAGPFQAYGSDPYLIARKAIEAGAHYLDLSDDAAFTAGIAALDDVARVAGVTALSGLSSVPAISSAIASDLVTGLDDIHLIESAILPGNRAPRGLSVMQAILAQAGNPMREWRGRGREDTTAWLSTKRINLGRGIRRAASPIGAPDLSLFPTAFNVRSVRFRAGLELGLLHHGLRVLALLRRLRLLPRLDRFARPLRWIAARLEGAGTDRGGMMVRVVGRGRDGTALDKRWKLRVSGGDGPNIPALPARIVAAKLAQDQMPPGAGPALSVFTREEAETALATLRSQIEVDTTPAPPLFEAALGADWPAMPPEFQAMHDVHDLLVSSGRARITRGTHPLARLIAAIFRFPPATDDTPVTVRMERTDTGETWTRDFNGKRFRSHLSPAGPGRFRERFGPLSFEMTLPLDDGAMGMEVTRGWFLGLPMPRPLLPGSDTREYIETGRFHFDVRLSAPIAGLIVHYQGWLIPR